MFDPIDDVKGCKWVGEGQNGLYQRPGGMSYSIECLATGRIVEICREWEQEHRK